MTGLEYIWTALLTLGFLVTFAMVIETAWTGRFWWSRTRNGRRWPPRRSEAPVKFWLLWMVYGWPLVFVPLLILIGLVGSVWSS